MTRHLRSLFRRRPRPDPSRVHAVRIYTRANCPLCEEAIAVATRVLQPLGAQPALVDVDTSTHLRARFTDCVPVVEVAGEQIADYIVTERQLRAALEN